MPREDYDIVSDLTDGTDDTSNAPVAVHANDVGIGGKDGVSVNQQQQTREAVEPKQIDDTAQPDENKPKSVRDILSSALKGEDQNNPPAAQQDGQARNPDGTFAPKTAETQEQVDPNAAPTVAAPQGIDPTQFASLPAETQAFLARTMEGVTKDQERFARLAPIEQVLSPRFDTWAMSGIAPAQALEQLLALSDFAGRDPAGFIKYIAQGNNVDLEELVLGMDEGEVQTDPAIQALQKEISELRGWKDGQTREQQQEAHHRTVQDVIAFADEKGQDGQPLRPYLTELGESWLPYISMVKQNNPNLNQTQILQQAYENACWSNPAVRAKMQQAAEAAAAAERLRKEQEKVGQARTASSSVRTGPPSAPAPAPNDPSLSTRDVIRAAIAAQT